MRELFSLDKKDYVGTEKVFSRPSARGIIVKNGQVLLVYSKKYDYYKFPGGGIEKGEANEKALIREVCEETGYRVIPESIKEYGAVLRRQLSRMHENEIFEQWNYYYLCDVEDEPGNQKLDDYEDEEGFTPVWMDPFKASVVNHYSENSWPEEKKHDEVKRDMVRRDERVLLMVDEDCRKNARKEHERETLKNMGPLDYAGMLDFVEQKLNTHGTEDIDAKKELNYSRFEHTKRVLGWALRLYEASEDKEKMNYEDLMIATIFHDVGRNIGFERGISHAEAGVPITKQYLVEHGFDESRADYIASLVGKHSDKWLMKDKDIDRNLLLLMEADLLDDMGALGLVMDCMIVRGRRPDAEFVDCYDHIMRFTHRIQQDNPMVSPEGKQMWDEKTKLVFEFTEQLYKDIQL